MKITSMKAFLFAAMVFSFTTVSSQNLVLNPSFEDHSPCPLSNAYIFNCQNWFFATGANAGFSYFNNCTPSPYYQIPNTIYGFQEPRTGLGMLGIQSTYYIGSEFPNISGDDKFYPEDSLVSKLVGGMKYHVGCYVNLGNNSTITMDNFGIYISDTIINKLSDLYSSGYHHHIIPNNKLNAQISNKKQRILSDTMGWMLIDGIYTAHGGEKYILLGSFANDSNTKFNQDIYKNVFYNYLYLDDVFVIPVHDSAVDIIEHDTTLCFGGEIILHINFPNSKHIKWQNGSTADSLIVNKAGTYWVRFDSASFSNTDTIHVRYDSIINTISNTLVACAFPDTFHTPSSAYIYTWPDNSTGNSFIFTNAGIYSYSIASGHCKANESIIVQSGVFPSVIFPADTVVCVDHPIQISLTNFTGSILWQDGNTNSDYVITKGGNYSLTLKNQCGTRTYTTTIADSNCNCFLYIPDAFSPNKDFHNDSFIQASNCITEKYSLQIYNRWGEMIVQSNEINTGWNGSFKSVISPPGVYIYKIIYKFEHGVEQEKMGTVEVI